MRSKWNLSSVARASLTRTSVAGVAALSLAALSSTAQADDPPNKPNIAAAETAYTGARVLRKDVELWGGLTAPGIYANDGEQPDDIQSYAYWQGDTMFLGAKSSETGNSVDAVVEWYWFESSVPKSSDFYVMVVKAKSSPNALEGWKLRQEEGWWTEFWEGNKPCQLAEVNMAEAGAAGSIRWDWSVPFQNYGWEPVGSIQIAQSYSVGFDGGADAGGQIDPLGKFKEGGFLKDVTSNANIQAKGQFNQKYAVSSEYTVTLYKWQMFVTGGATGMRWDMVVGDEGSVADDSAYHEYFVVVQAPQGSTAKIDAIDIAANFYKPISFWFDDWESLSSSAINISFHPPVEVECYLGSQPPTDLCSGSGACGDTMPICDAGAWVCPTSDDFEKLETLCDGIDNDCDGEVDEDLTRPCSTDCGVGVETCYQGSWGSCDADQPQAEECDGIDNDCDGEIDNVAKCDEPVDPPVKPPVGEPECNDGDSGPKGFCGPAGVCYDVVPTCIDGEWDCEKPAEHEKVETLCDGLDNDCDGKVDEGIAKSCDNACGQGMTYCEDGAWTACDAPQPEPEVCDGYDNDCDGWKDNAPECDSGNPGGPGNSPEPAEDPGVPVFDDTPSDGIRPGATAVSEEPAPAGCSTSDSPAGGLGALLLGLGLAVLGRRRWR